MSYNLIRLFIYFKKNHLQNNFIKTYLAATQSKISPHNIYSNLFPNSPNKVKIKKPERQYLINLLYINIFSNRWISSKVRKRNVDSSNQSINILLVRQFQLAKFGIQWFNIKYDKRKLSLHPTAFNLLVSKALIAENRKKEA